MLDVFTSLHRHARRPGEQHGRQGFGARIAKAARWLKGLYDCMNRTRTFGLAAETAFWLFLSLLPLAAVGGLVAARVTTHNYDRLSPFLTALPPAARTLIESELVHVSSWNGGAVSITSAVVFVWLASSGVHALFEALELETGEQRPWWKKRALSVVTCVVLSVLVAVITVLGPGLETLFDWTARVVPALRQFDFRNTWWELPARIVLTLGLGFGYVSGLYWVGIPPRARGRLPILPGAAVAVAIQVALRFGYAYYLDRFSDGAAYSAGLAVIGLTLTALYLFAVALLTGAVVNHMLGSPNAPGTDARRSSGPAPR
ncbi:MAG TPA: YihY/virulence factor BrkB family protein [Polyangiaceae bacterium]|nr:YihY/virulence factor BrkB family protein [Polyangiaceae bacterium]